MTPWQLVLEARRHGLEFIVVGAEVRVRVPADEVDSWVERLRPHRDSIRALLVEDGASETLGAAINGARASAVVGAAIGLLSIGGRLCSCCHRIGRCFEREDGFRVCGRCVDRSERGAS